MTSKLASLCVGALAAGLLCGPAAAQPPRPDWESAGPLNADPVQRMVSAIVRSGDNDGRPFMVVDKLGATVAVFDPGGELIGDAAALLGAAKGDDSAPWIGERELSDIRPEERTTPAGRFEAGLGPNLAGREVLWIDYDAAVSLHPVINTAPKERRLQRLASGTPADNRISYGCINVGPGFFRNIVRPAFAGGGVVYILPEARSARAVFPGLIRGPRRRG
jgi:hypothetical protein